MKKIIFTLLTALVLSSCVQSPKTFVIEEALVQKKKSELLSETKQFAIYRIAPQPEKGFHWPYLIMVGKDLSKQNDKTIYVQTVNTGFTSNSYRVHEEKAQSSLITLFKNYKNFNQKMVYVMPVFLRPKSDWKLYTHALDRDSMLTDKPKYKRLDLQVLSMVDDAKKALKIRGIKTRRKFAIGGFSGSGDFAQRFSILHPEALSFVIAGGIGGLAVLPLKHIDNQILKYPVGIADLEELSGKPFDQDRFFKLPRLLYYGDKDLNDPVRYIDAYSATEQNTIFTVLDKDVSKRWLKSIQIYDKFETKSQLLVDQDTGHWTSNKMHENIFSFIARELKKPE